MTFKQWLTALLLVAAFGAQAVEIHGVKIAETAQVGDTTLVLNGAGTRIKVFFKVYVTALYVSAKKTDAATILEDSGTKRVNLTFLREADADQFITAMNEGLNDNNSAAALAALSSQLKTFRQMIVSVGEVNPGDVVTLDYLPGKGTQVLFNGKSLGIVTGEQLYTALLKIWLGEHPVDTALKKALLGN
ncbi:MAG: chalcone isomerase family protein [Methylophilaceae bacterium]